MFLWVRYILGLNALLYTLLLHTSPPEALYLTWDQDPTNTMTVVWIGGTSDTLRFRLWGHTDWKEVRANCTEISEAKAVIFKAHLKELKSDALYGFKVGEDAIEYQFKTLPLTLKRPLRFVVGGDMFYHWNEEVFDRMNHAVAYDEPDFAVLGGDLAYTIGVKVPFSGMEWQMQRWTLFLRKLQTTLKSQKNRLIPILPVVGNHDVHGKDTHQKELFFLIFPFPDNQKAYRSFYVGSYLHLVFLDTGHSASIEGEQTEWLRKELQHSQSPYLFAAYHVGAYPSVYNYKGKTPELLRKTWVPIFEKESVLAAFEHHSHAFKRTYPIKNEKIDMSGVTYLGDGSWGVPPRKVYTPQSLWYLKKSSSVNACWFVSLTEEKAFIEARTLAGEIIDQLELSPRLFEEMKE